MEEARELYKAYYGEKLANSEETFLAWFKESDKDGNGTISKEEQKSVLIKCMTEWINAELAKLGA